MSSYQLRDFSFSQNWWSGDLLLMANGSVNYVDILKRTFPHLHFSSVFKDKKQAYEWGFYIKKANDTDKVNLKSFCSLLQQYVFIEDELNENFALSYHQFKNPQGILERTPMGQLIYQAKPYSLNNGNKNIAKEIAFSMISFIENHPIYRQAELIAAVPPSNQKKNFDLPTYLVEEIARVTGQMVATKYISKIRTTIPMKNCKSLEQKQLNIKGVFKAELIVFNQRTIIIVDDIYQTGTSINEVGRTLRKASASKILGLVATKTFKDIF